MFVSKLDEFCDATSVAGATGTRNLGTSVDMAAVDPGDIGGAMLYLVIQVTAAFGTASGTATVSFTLASDNSSSPDVAGNATVHMRTATWNHTALTAGTTVCVMPIPQGAAAPYERYLGVQIVNGTEALNAGAIDAFLTCNPPLHKNYADGAPDLS